MGIDERTLVTRVLKPFTFLRMRFTLCRKVQRASLGMLSFSYQRGQENNKRLHLRYNVYHNLILVLW